MNDSTELRDSDNQHSTLYSPLVEKAIRVAAVAHRNQTRKSSDLPYFQHPASVALILARCGFDDDHLLAAAILHDTVEDTECTFASLTVEFPEAVVKLVRECSEAKTDVAGAKIPWRVRKESHIAVVRQASHSARAIVLADKLHNLGSMIFDLDYGEELWSRFNSTPNDLIWYHREIVAAACEAPADRNSPETTSQLEQLAADCQRLIEQLAASIPK